ncbi:MAG TPA: TIGR00730 family Rossman fold protein, partial [Bacteroidales bacterium]|nr:TIGR00730 family Rossman fold protein [Bacteroidales bacterium]
DMVKVDNMHERKYLMRQNADAVVALPGGVGTLEELMEVITLKQLGQFNKPVVILNTNNYYEPLLKLLQNMSRQKFMRDIHNTIWQVVNSADNVIDAINNAPVWDSTAIKYAAVIKD